MRHSSHGKGLRIRYVQNRRGNQACGKEVVLIIAFARELAAYHIDDSEEIVEKRCDDTVSCVAVPCAVVARDGAERAASPR